TAALGAGSYSFKAKYVGDDNYAASPFSDDEPLTINQGTSSVSTNIRNAAGGSVIPLNSLQPLGTSAYDTASVTGSPAAFPPIGNVAFYFSTDGGVTYTLFTTLPFTTLFRSTAALGAGSYSFKAKYVGDGNYAASSLS